MPVSFQNNLYIDFSVVDVTREGDDYMLELVGDSLGEKKLSVQELENFVERMEKAGWKIPKTMWPGFPC